MSSDEGGPSKRARMEQPSDREQPLDVYMYETLFKQQQKSDITVVVLGKEWKLHKIIIERCLYFASMLSGKWKESKANVINVTIEDSEISNESLEAVFGSMYGGDVVLTSQNVISILATASLFLMQELIDKCERTMIETIDKDNAMSYYNASETYGIPNVKSNVIQWLELNLMICSYEEGWGFMKDISSELLKDVISSQNFVEYATEYSSYLLLRKWLYLKLRKSRINYSEFYKKQTWKTSLLLTQAGKTYKPLFETINIRCLLDSEEYMQTIENDNIVPKDWIQSAYKNFWQYSIKIRQNKDLGPTNVPDDVFEKECMHICWTREEFKKNFFCKFSICYAKLLSLDFELVFREEGLKITRKRRETKQCIHVPATKRNVMLKVMFVAYDGKRYTKVIQKSGLMSFSLALDEEQLVMAYDKDISYPLLMVAKILTVTPQ